MGPRGTEDEVRSTCIYCSSEDEGNEESSTKKRITKDHCKEMKHRANRRHPVKKTGKRTG